MSADLDALEDAPPGFNLLSLDGGGVKGIFSAALLAGIESICEVSISDHFDLIVGTSTGGIIALGLGAGYTPAEIVDIYVEQMSTIFPGGRYRRAARQLYRAKYDAEGLETVARSVFGDRTLGDSEIPLVITSYDIGENAVHLFKTPHHERLKRDYRIPMWQVAMATAAAPTYFPAYCLPADESRLVDGGLWASNPALVGVAEATSLFNQPLGNIRMLSVGTTLPFQRRARRHDRGGLWQWTRRPNIVDTILDAQSHGTFTQVQHLIGREHAHRLDPPVPIGLTRLDRADARDLLASAAHHARDYSPRFEETFATHTAAAYIPLRRVQHQEEAEEAA